MSKHFTCLSILLIQLSCLTAQVNLQTSFADNGAGNSQREQNRSFAFTNESFVTLIKTISQRESEKAFIGKEETLNNKESYFKEFASDHGVTSSQLKELVNQWANADSVKDEVNDFMLQGARTYYLQQFNESSLYYEQAALLRTAAIRDKQQDATTIDAICNAYVLAGNSASEGNDFKRAIQLYYKADSIITLPGVQKDNNTFAKTKMRLQEILAVVLYEEGSRAADSEGVALLTQAIRIEQAALANYSKDHFPQEWARAQSNLGTVLQEQAGRLEEVDAVSLLKQSIAAYKAALDVYTKKDFPQEWARSYNNLGVVYSKLGNTSAETTLLDQAVIAFQTALEVYTQKDFPQDWALTQYNLANMFQAQAGNQKDQQAAAVLFERSIAAYRLALEVFTQLNAPEEWAWTQYNLGISLFEQGRNSTSTDLLTQSITAFRAALIVRDRQCFPEEWARTQYDLGTALWEVSSRTEADKTTLLDQSAIAYKAALEIYTEKDTQEWFNAQSNLGLVYEQQKQWAKALQCFENLRDADPVYAAKKENEVRRKAQL
jgi:tetratricopeptide (TPR) repeat protein